MKRLPFTGHPEPVGSDQRATNENCPSLASQQAVAISGTAGLPWECIHATEQPPIMFDVERCDGSVRSFTYSSLLETKFRDAGHIVLCIYGMEKYQIIIEGRHLREFVVAIKSGKIKSFKPGCVFINTSRAELADTKALVDGLSEGRIAAVGVDVLLDEPEITSDPLWRYAKHHHNVVISPHIGGFCPEAVDQVIEFSAKRVVAYLGNT